MIPTREQVNKARADLLRAYPAGDQAGIDSAMAVLRAWAARDGPRPDRRRGPVSPVTRAKMREAAARRKANVEKRRLLLCNP
jgi:hypothetical protein